MNISKYNDFNSDTNDDLEETLVLAAASATSQEPTDYSNSETENVEPENEVEEKDTTEQPETSSLKRTADDLDESNTQVPLPKQRRVVAPSEEGYAPVVAKHYNNLEEKGLDERSKSRIFHMRNFHNWIKSMLINEYLTKIKNERKYNAKINVFDMCCGKGGDLQKWKKGNISHLICTDIAEVSLDQCKVRYEEMKNRSSRERNGGKVYSTEFILADCTRDRLRGRYKDVSMSLDLVSCQFAFHYSFESLPQAENMLRNASECLAPGGFFIGTIPDAYELVARVRKNGGNTFGNDLYQVVFHCDTDNPPLFGARYDFRLDGVVNCPEFLVHFPTFEKLAKKYGLKLVKKEKFYDFYLRMKEEGNTLLSNMKGLETYPPANDSEPLGTAEDDYNHADEYIRRNFPKNSENTKVGTLSKSDWEVSSLYLTFVFVKVKNTQWNQDGTPLYDI